MKKLSTLFLFAISIITWSFINVANENIAGTYGVCSTKNITVELKLNKDNSFEYINNSNPKKLIHVNGKWSVKKNKIMLHDYSPELKIHNKWKLDKQGIAVSARNGLAFYRLVNKNNCGNAH